VRIAVRALDDGGAATATEPARCAENARRAAADATAIAVIGTYELGCSERALRVLAPAGLPLVSPLNAAARLPGALRLAPTLGDQGTAAAQLAQALGATRIAIVSRRAGAAPAFTHALEAAAAAAGADAPVEMDASETPVAVLLDELQAGGTRLVALAGAPGTWSTDLLRALALLPAAVRPAVVAPQSFDTLAFLDGAGAAAEGVRVLSRFVPAEQLGDRARAFAADYADEHGQPPPVAAYAADAADAVLDAVRTPATSRRAVARALAALPAHDGLLGRWAATPSGGITPRKLAVLLVANGAFRVERVVTVSDPLPAAGGVK
jgi:ABC-type branched-subunit amino acid transport system substrate-binding protein